MAKANHDHLIPDIQAEFRTGHYTVRKLAEKHKVSVGFISKHTKGMAKDLKEVVNAGVSYKYAISEDAVHDNEQNNEHVRKAVTEVVDERTRHLVFFNNSALKNQQLANKRLSGDMGVQELESHSRITARNKETVLGKSPDTAIQINNTKEDVKPFSGLYGVIESKPE